MTVSVQMDKLVKFKQRGFLSGCLCQLEDARLLDLSHQHGNLLTRQSFRLQLLWVKSSWLNVLTLFRLLRISFRGFKDLKIQILKFILIKSCSTSFLDFIRPIKSYVMVIYLVVLSFHLLMLF